jgi:Mrp family chromosome partitioning ATPase/capsular polysaccharide biosynthesis protein
MSVGHNRQRSHYTAATLSSMSPYPSQGPATAEPALGPYLRAVKAHRLLVALVTLGTLLLAIFWLAAVRTPTYEATAQLLVTPLPQDDQVFLGLQLLRDSGDPTRTVQTAANLVGSPTAADRTAEEMGDGWTGSRVTDSISIEPQGESNILAVTASAGSPEEAVRLADTFTRQALATRKEELQQQIEPLLTQLESRSQSIGSSDTEAAAELQDRINQLQNVRTGTDPTLAVSQFAEEPDSPSGAGPVIILALALVAGGALGAGAAVLIELLDSRIRDEDEALAIFPLPVLARVPVGRHKLIGARSGEPWMLAPAVREACRTLNLQLSPRNGEAGRVVMMTSASTGDGKTTSAINLAATLAASGEKVVLLDFDLRKPDVARQLGVSRPTSLRQMLAGGADLPSLLQSPQSLPSVSVLATGLADGAAALLESLYRRLPELVEEARALADHVVIDTPPLGEISDALRLLDVVDDVVVVMRPGNTERNGLATTADLLARAQATPSGFLVIGGSFTPSSSYYSYGLAGRELFVGTPPAPPPQSARPSRG